MASSSKPLSAFFVWTVTSFLCHKLAKLAVDCFSSNMTSLPPGFGPLVVTMFQSLSCYTMVSFSSNKGRLFTVVAASHFVATLATNTSFLFIFASSTMAFKLLEPMTSAVIQSLVLRTRMPPGSVVSMLVIVGGAVMFAGNPFESGVVVRGVLTALLSNVILGLRNVGIKLDQTTGKHMRVSSERRLLAYGLAVASLLTAAYLLETHASILPAGSSYFLSLAFASSLCHVTYSYVSTNVVLRYMTVVSHSIANVVKRVLVVLMLYVSGRRFVSWWNWAGLVLCTCGLLLYSLKKTAASLSSTESSVTSSGLSSDSCVETGSQQTGGQVHQDSKNKKTALLQFLLVVSLLPYVLCFLDTAALLQFNQNYAHQLRHGQVKWRDGQALLDKPIVFRPLEKNESVIRLFLQKELINVPFETDALSPYLTSTMDVIREAQRVQLNLLSSLIGGRKYVILVGLASFENKGDPAITIGQVRLIEALKLELVYYINEEKCYNEYFETAKNLTKYFTPEELVIFMQGGGNLIGYEGANNCRKKAMDYFPGYKKIILSQSIYMRGSKSLVDRMVSWYCCDPNLTIFLRDHLSLYMATRMFNNGTKLILAPDMAFGNGPIPRFTAPFYDVMWLKRIDDERPGYHQTPAFPSNVTVQIGDWWKGWDTAHGASSLETANNVFLNGLVFLQRGRVVITERLHGHIMSTLLDIPHVVLDNGDNKLSSYHNTWTRGLRNVRLTNNPRDAVKLALELLKEYDNYLPKTVKASSVKV